MVVVLKVVVMRRRECVGALWYRSVGWMTWCRGVLGE